jgi:hypothetical protein
MTETEWLACESPVDMLRWFGERGSKRKWRLSACACCRTVWPLLTDERSRTAVVVAEKYADNRAADYRPEFKLTYNGAVHAVNDAQRLLAESWPGIERATVDAAEAALGAIVASTGGITGGGLWSLFRSVARSTDEATSYARQAGILRDVFGNSFRPVTLDPAWRTSTVVALARGMYESRDFGAMPILADALQDAGCDSADVLGHCRGPGPHVRGCWVADLVLGKA